MKTAGAFGISLMVLTLGISSIGCKPAKFSGTTTGRLGGNPSGSAPSEGDSMISTNGIDGGVTGAGGTSTGAGGASTGAGGTSTGAGGTSTGAGGTSTGAGGTSAGAGGTSTGAGGTSTGAGGTSTGAGGASNGAGGTSTGAGGASTGAGGGTDPASGGTSTALGGGSTLGDTLQVSETFRLLRACNATNATQKYGVGLLTFKASGLRDGESILSVERSGISTDVRVVSCSTGAVARGEVKEGRQLYVQTQECFLLFRGLKTPKAMHRFYTGLKRVAKVGTAAAPRLFTAGNSVCVVPLGETEPCAEKVGRLLVKPIEPQKTIADFGYPFVDFPADSVIDGDIRGLK